MAKPPRTPARIPDGRIQNSAAPLSLLPQRAIYALRAMAMLANLAPGESLRSDELAEQAAIPIAFVSKVMRRLVAGGLVDSRRGHGGGFRLAAPPSRISFRAILAAVGFELDPQQCAFGFAACDAQNPCALHFTWAALKQSMAGWADGATLADTRDERSRR